MQILFSLTVLIIFALIDTIQITLYPFIFMGMLENVKLLIINQLPEPMKHISLYILLVILMINVVLRIIAIVKLIKKRKDRLAWSLISNGFTTLLVNFLLTSNAIWESISMIILSVIIFWGYKKESNATKTSSE